MPEHPAISVIIPCWRDEQALAQLLGSLLPLFQAAKVDGEVIVVDAANSGQCRQLCEQHAASWLPATPCRGEQLRLGAGHARHPLLWFLHADAHLQATRCPRYWRRPPRVRQVAISGFASPANPAGRPRCLNA